MKSTIVLFILALIVATVQAVTFNTNGERLARGLPPRAPRRLYRNSPTGVEQAKRSKPSGTPPPSQCTTGPVQCCNTVEKASAPGASLLLGLLNIVLKDLDVLVGLGCSPLTGVGIGSGSCSATTVCCENNSHGTLISIGCIPIFL